MPAVRLGAVVYLNARPLTWALDASPELRFVLPVGASPPGVLCRGRPMHPRHSAQHQHGHEQRQERWCGKAAT